MISLPVVGTFDHSSSPGGRTFFWRGGDGEFDGHFLTPRTLSDRLLTKPQIQRELRLYFKFLLC